MHSHSGLVATQDIGFRIWKWITLLLAIYISSLFLPATLHSPHLQFLLILRQTVTCPSMVFVAARTSVRKAANFISHGGHSGPGQAAHKLRNGAPIRHASTNIHSSHSLGPHHAKHKLFSETRNFLTRIFNGLAAPGLRVPTHYKNTGAVRSLHSGTMPTIKSGLSFHVRIALSSGPRHKLPRPPFVGAHVVTNVGLGLARNFSTARPIFQNIVDNVPVVCRAFYEAELDLRKGHPKRPRSRPIIPSTQKKTKEMSKLRSDPRAAVFSEDPKAEIAHYFDNHVAPVTTYLLVPLAPTPSSRVPLSEEPILCEGSPMLLPPLSLFEQYHALHENHAARVSSLFLRLDQAGVWSRGARCSAYSQRGEDSGQCTMLAVEFTGWTGAEVKAVVGEGGTGWCELIERKFDNADEMSECSATEADEIAAVKNSDHDQVSSSFVMPTIDLSSTGFESSFSSPSPDLSFPSSAFSSQSMSPFSDTISDYDDLWCDAESGNIVEPRSYSSSSERASERSWERMSALEFSAQHLNHWN